jgi:hypothetical protein
MWVTVSVLQADPKVLGRGCHVGIWALMHRIIDHHPGI